MPRFRLHSFRLWERVHADTVSKTHSGSRMAQPSLGRAAGSHDRLRCPRPVPRARGAARGVVHMKTFINPDGRTAQTLGREREGSAIVIDSNGLILTIGYLWSKRTPPRW